MADTIYVDLALLKRVSDNGLGPISNGLKGCVPEVRINPEMKAAILAIDAGRIDRIVEPFELGSTPLAAK